MFWLDPVWPVHFGPSSARRRPGQCTPLHLIATTCCTDVVQCIRFVQPVVVTVAATVVAVVTAMLQLFQL